MSNHKAIVAVVTEVIAIPGADKIHVAKVLGEQVIVGKDVGVGYVGVLFPVDLQLSVQYCHENNLFRKAELNKDTTKTGFFEESRRVRAQPFLKVRSEGYFASVDSLYYTLVKAGGEELMLGKTFDTLNSFPICEKYISQATRELISKQGQPKQAKKNFAMYFEKHQDSAQFKHSVHMIPVGSLLSFHSKKHGTSFRQAYTKLSIELPKWRQLINKIRPEFFPTWQWGHVVGTRNVVLTSSEKEGWHGSEQFRFDVAKEIASHLEKGMQCFGEIVGFVNGKSIMPSHSIKSLKDKAYTKKYGDNINYTYGCAEHEFKYHVYRLTYLTEEGKNIDFTQKQLEQWCKDRQIPYTLEVSPQEIYDGDVDKLMAKVEYLTERPDVLTEDFTEPKHISEGIILRIDTGKHQPYFLKSKSFAFKACEGICEVVDTEDCA